MEVGGGVNPTRLCAPTLTPPSKARSICLISFLNAKGGTDNVSPLRALKSRREPFLNEKSCTAQGQVSGLGARGEVRPPPNSPQPPPPTGVQSPGKGQSEPNIFWSPY